MALTDAGQDFYEAALRLLDDFDAAASRLGWGQSAPSGLVRITVAPVFGDRLITETGRLLPPLSERVGPVHRHRVVREELGFRSI
jgi:DNA-binding transcriptional LysR family regulator